MNFGDAFYGASNSKGPVLRLLSTFVGVLREKNSYVRHFKGKHSKYIPLECLINVDFGKKI